MNGVAALLNALKVLSAWLLVGLALAGVAVLYAPSFAEIDPTKLRQEWGVWIWAATITFSVLALVRLAQNAVEVVQKRHDARAARRPLRIVPLDQRHWWHLAKQRDDTFISQFSLDCQASNTGDQPIQIVKVRLIRPRAKVVRANALLPMRGSSYHSAYHPIPPHDSLVASVDIQARGRLGSPGKPIRVTVGLTDQLGEEYRLKSITVPSRDKPESKPRLLERIRSLRDGAFVLAGAKRDEPVPGNLIKWEFDSDAESIQVCQSILDEEKRSYAARGRSRGMLGSLNVGLQSEPNAGWSKEGEIPK
ncbi:MAG: hypothetical protein ACRED5_09100, partial [Propylenella sp.]